jgi:ATP-binding cassette subfamily F protein uup
MLRGLRVAYLPQNPTLDPRLTVLTQLFHEDTPAMRLVRSYEEASDALAHAPADQGLQARVATLVEQIDAADAWGLEQAARTILTKLGLSDLGAAIGTLSGGQRKRVALAAALINPADLLILDEPTNHIDTATVAWLEEFLSRTTSALLLVTHDRYFLDRVCQRIVELDGGRLYSYPGAYSRFLELKAERSAQQASDEARRQTILKKELAWLRRGARARTTKQQARIDRINTLQADAPDAQRGTVEIGSATRRLGKTVVELRGVSKRYGARQIIHYVTLSIGAGDRIGIIGPNGSGKTTLLQIIAGRLAPDTGSVELGKTVHLSVYDQESTELDTSQRMIEYVKEGAELIQTGEGALVTAAQMLERFLFPPASHYSLIGTLSGGERRRLYLLRKLIDAPNLLLLDEPTNDLDIQTLGVLEDYLDSFAGTVVAVSHDRYFLDRIVERTLAFEQGAIVEYPGGYSAYAEALAQRAAGEAAAARPKPKPASLAASANAARPRRLSFAETRELRELEGKIAGLEQEQALLGEQINAAGGDYQVIQRLSAELERSTAALEAAFERWAELAELAEAR